MDLNTSQRYCWNELLGEPLTTQELGLSLFASLAMFHVLCAFETCAQQ